MHPLPIVLLGILAALLLVAIVTDLRSRLIGNGLNAAVALLAVPWWLACGWSLGAIGIQVAIAAVVFTVFVGFFAVGMMGGGDVKLLGALALWLPLPLLMPMLLWMAIGGGALTLAMLAHHRWTAREGAVEVPYGVAIAGATIFIMANHILTNPAA